MPKNLIIVESPAKVKTIMKFLDKDYDVVSSYGHVRALPSKTGSVDIENDFAPLYQVLPDKKKVIAEIKKHLKGVTTIYLATDMDREGEAIAWHLYEVLGLKKKKVDIKRIAFSEITKKAVIEAIQNPRDISADLVDAQKARVVLDYLVGFNLSPFLWKKIRYGLSAGRVQSVALRLICDREQEIKAFNEQEYWTISSQLNPEKKKKDTLKANLISVAGNKLKKFDIPNKEQAETLLAELKGCAFSVAEVREKNVKRNPAPPFITSTLQQEASRKLGFRPRKTMMTAQKLYEGVNISGESIGLITYMRTDSVKLSDDATKEISELIGDKYGKDYLVKGGRHFKRKVKNAQEAHEAIRPTSALRTPDSIKKILKGDAFKLYELIWKRAVASQMANALFKNVAADILAEDKPKKKNFLLRATGSTMVFDGFLKLYIEGRDDNLEEDGLILLPQLQAGDKLDLKDIVADQHFTQPPPRYTEATLVKTLEEHGIGRPSTYANIINTLLTRKYAILEKRRFVPEDVGMIVSKLLSDHFSKYVDYGFTAQLEEELDNVATGNSEWLPLMKNFWEPFIKQIKDKEATVNKADITTESTEEICPDCGKNLLIRLGRSGKFYGCSGFPECKYTRPLNVSEADQVEPEVTDEKCEKCGEPMVIKLGRYGKFLGCSGYPKCKNIQSLVKPEKTGINCPDCEKGELTKKMSQRYKKVFYSCDSYPKCKYIVNFKPIDEKCPDCGSKFLLDRNTKTKGHFLSCPVKECKYTKSLDKDEK